MENKAKVGAYRANIVAYTVAWLSFWIGDRLNLDRIWEKLRERSRRLGQDAAGTTGGGSTGPESPSWRT